MSPLLSHNKRPPRTLGAPVETFQEVADRDRRVTLLVVKKTDGIRRVAWTIIPESKPKRKGKPIPSHIRAVLDVDGTER